MSNQIDPKVNGLASMPTTANTTYYPYQNPTPGHIPLMGVGMLPGFSYYDKPTLQLMKDCGLNIVESTLSISNEITCQPYEQTSHPACDKPLVPNVKYPNIDISIRNAEEVGIKLMLRIPNAPQPQNFIQANPSSKLPEGEKSIWLDWFNDWITLSRLHKSNETVAGYMLGDEPTMSNFWGYAVAKGLIDTTTKGSKMVYVNLLQCQYQKADQRYFAQENVWQEKTDYPAVTFEEYLSTFHSLLKPSLLSYDSYPFKTVDGKVVTRPEYWYSLIKYSKYSRQYGIPFWAYVLSNGVNAETGGLCNPTLGRLRFSAFSALAYGAKGIVYWRICQGLNYIAEANSEIYTNAPINLYGETTETYSMVKTVNSQIKKIESILLSAEWVETKVSRWPSTYPLIPESGIPGAGVPGLGAELLDGPIGSIKSITTSNSGCIISIFREKIDANIIEYAMVVNMNSEESQKVGIQFDGLYRKISTSADNDDGFPAFPPPSITAYSGELAPGDWWLFSRPILALPNDK